MMVVQLSKACSDNATVYSSNLKLYQSDQSMREYILIVVWYTVVKKGELACFW